VAPMDDMSGSRADELPWLAHAIDQARGACARGRLGHAILVVAAPGLGADIFARWLAALVLCDNPGDRPCRQCASCTLLGAGNHPDYREMARLEDATQVKVEQVRELSESLSLKSYRGGYKAAIVPEADLMNENAANALLKTLEEPPPATLLVLCSARPSRLPATIVSRCQRIELAAPERGTGLAWLNARVPSDRWPSMLEHAAGAPLRAMELHASGFSELDRDMHAIVDRLSARTLDVHATAERWYKTDLELRLAWLDTWIGRQVRQALAPELQPPRLPPAREIRNIRGLFALLDRVRAARLELDTPLNKQLATEELLLRAESVLGAT
jgi:DNA polymerase III subunit delta'